MTTKLYFKNTYQYETESIINSIEKDEKGMFIVLNQTVFYPQGGGQPSDHGLIRNSSLEASVFHVTQIDEKILHYINIEKGEIHINDKIHCIIDDKRRLLNARYHTASHLISNVVEKLYPQLKAIKGHSFPGEAYVDFQIKTSQQTQLLEDEITKIIQSTTNDYVAKNDKTTIFYISPKEFEEKFYKLPYNIPYNKKFRVMQIENMSPIPCGGTHLSYINEIESIIITKIKMKNQIMRVSYTVANSAVAHSSAYNSQ